MSSSILKNALECLEDTLTSPVLRQNKYQEVLNGLKTSEAIDDDTARRLIAVCIKDFNKDTKYATNASTVVGSFLTKIKKGQCSPPPNLALSAICVINLLKTIAFGKFDALKGILFNTLLSYPENTLICVVTENSDNVIDFLKAYVSASNKVVPITFLNTLLKILPPANKISFVKEALALWFTKVIPFTMNLIQADLLVTPCIELLELLTEILVDIEYSDNSDWNILIECFYNPKKYPLIMKSMLDNDSDVWHRLWIISIKLLKDQITKINNSTGSPINSLLPVVEAAFKMDLLNRCRAFQCWSVLIDNFSKDSNEAYVHKRLKLLLLPLKSNNAKVEVTAISKFNTWWHLIGAFHCRMESLTEMILMPFIHFCFGKPAANSPVAPGQFSNTLKELSLQALVEIFGHVDCEGCTNIPKLRSRLINTKILVDHWNDWIYCFKAAVTTALGSNSEPVIRQITCIWKSLVMTIAELPENNIRKDLFNELLELISLFVQGCQTNTKLADLVMNILIKSLFEDDNKIKSLLVTKKTGPMFVILPMLSNPFMEEIYKGKSMDEVLSFFKPVTTFMMNEILCCPNRIITWLLKRLPRHGSCVVFWIALVDAVCESKQDLAEETLVSILSYPLQNFGKYSKEMCTVAAYKWFTTYSTLRHKISITNIDQLSLKIFSEQTKRDCLASKVFMLHVSLAVVKQNLLQNIDDDCAYVTQIFLNSLSSIDAYSSIEKVLPALIDTLILMSSKLKDCINLQFAKFFVSALKLTMKLLLQQTLNDTTIIFVEKMLISLLDIVRLKEYQDLVLTINDEILAWSSIEKTHASKISYPLSILTSLLSEKKNKKSSEPNEHKEKDTIDNKIANNEGNIKNVPDNFNNAEEDMKSSNLPNANIFCKKSNKRAASIVKTVVENGEKFVVVKSNWKFNPRNLTENQKEKLKRKREDIPALYQDLSQSQDECSLRAWRTESQDATTTSTTSSKSASKSNKEDATTILNQIPSTDVVPRIFENILADSAKNKVDDKSNGDNSIFNNNNLNGNKQSTSTKDAMSPRLALKDRVFRNVRNLIERSSLPKDTLLSTEDTNKALNENTAKTPTSKANVFMSVNSAPPKIVSERPSRVIKKPKKFEDSEIISLRKRRHSQDPRTDASEINNLKKRQQSQDLRSDNLKNSHESKDLQSKDAETKGIKTKQSQQSRPDASKITSLKKRQQSVNLETVTSDIPTVTNTEQLLNTQSDGETTDLKTKQQPQDSQLGASKIIRLNNQQLSQDSQSVPSETFSLTNSQQLQETQPDASKISSFKEERQSVYLESVTSDIITVARSQQPLASHYDDETTDLKWQSPNSRLNSSKIIRSRNEQLSQNSQSDPSETFNLTNSEQLQDSRPYAAKICSLRKRRRQLQDSKSVAPDTSSFKKKLQTQDSPLNNSSESQSDSTDALPTKAVKGGAIVQMECNNVASHKNDVIEFSNYDIQCTQNHNILADSQPEKQSAITVKDVMRDSQPTIIVPIQGTGPDSEPIEHSTDSVTVRDNLSDSQLKEHSNNNDRQDTQNHVILADSQPKEQSNSLTLQDILLPDSQLIEASSNSVPLLKENKEEKFMDDNNVTKEIPLLAKTDEKDTKEKSLSAKKQKSRLKESNKLLLIDMVQGHPGITKSKRLRTKYFIDTTNLKKRQLPSSEKREKFKSDRQIVSLSKSATKATKKQKDKTNVSSKETVISLNESQENENTSISSDDQFLSMSEDFIESSQDSTNISLKSSKSILKNRPLVIDNVILPETSSDGIISLSDTSSSDQENKEDSLFPKNVTVENSALELTENMNTQPVDDSGDVMFVTNEQSPIVINTENTLREPNTQETAEADTEPMNVEITKTSTSNSETDIRAICNDDNRDKTTKSISEALESLDPVDQTYSPSKDEPERNKDFLNNTQEISPIKTLSPLREKQSSSPETSRDYVVIKLTSPVHSNGEPFEKCDSPEVFTEDKISPDKRNESPPRVEVIVNTSPSSSLSLKKNRPQRRAGGRAAQMLDLCAIMNKDNSTDATDTRRNTPAKRNLKHLYNSSVGDINENTATKSESAEIEHFLEFKKSLPSTESSPAGPILKRKFTEITDETTSSPANKRKRVSFHDPPVSTTVAVQKYIEPGAIHSPQHLTIKRRDRPVRNHATMKSPKRLESVFKLENVLSKAVESFTEDAVVASIGDTEMSSIEQTPTPDLDIVKPGDLNDTEPICTALLGCKDPIENIAAELSSPAMKSLFIKEMEGKVGTIAELAKMTEIEINRLCIKAPKVQVAKKVLLDYAFKKLSTDTKLDNQENLSLVTPKQVEIVHLDAQTQTSETERSNCEMQTDATTVVYMQTQTDCMQVAHTSAQTDESGHTSTKDVIASCLSERPDFVAQLSKHLEVSSVNMIADNALSFDDVLELLSKKMTSSNSVEVINKVLEVQSNSDSSCNSTENKVAFIQDYLSYKFDSNELFHIGIQLVQNAYKHKPT